MPKLFGTGRIARGANIIFLMVIAAVFLGALSGRADNVDEEGTPSLKKLARCSWDEPTYGTPVRHYILQVAVLGNADTTTYDSIPGEFFDVCVEFGYVYKARVAGVDSLNRQGPWSLWTLAYGPEAGHEDPEGPDNFEPCPD